MAKAMDGKIYHHYKDPDMRYRVLNASATLEASLLPCVVYQQLYVDAEHKIGTVWVREKESFEGVVKLPDGRVVDRFSMAPP